MLLKPVTIVTFLVAGGLALAQTNVLTVNPVPKLRVKRGDTATAVLHAQIKPGYHANSDKPTDEYLIPMKLTWQADPLQVSEVIFPKAQMEKYAFSEKPLSVYSGDFDVTTKFKAPPNAPRGPAILSAKLRYQACNDRMCLPPKTVDISLTVDIQ